MLDQFNRNIDYLRISVTDRCNLRCVYCMPASGIKLLPHEAILSYGEITEVARVAVAMGVRKVRLTGGEPLVRKHIITLVGQLSRIEGIRDFGMTTNGILLDRYAAALKNAGLHRVNVSLDTMDPAKYAEVTRGGNIHKVFEGIEAALNAGLTPVKLNCVIRDSPLEPDAVDVTRYAERKGLQVRYIKQMNLTSGSFSKVIGGEGGNCRHCNRLRLTSDGYLKPCLFSDIGYSVRELGPAQAIELALQNKPWCGMENHSGTFYNIGG
ncbi:MAG: radical SAM protein [Bacteroidales bacterium]